MAEAFGAATYDAVNVGANETLAGAPAAFTLIDQYKFPAVSANVLAPGEGATPPAFLVIGRGGLTVGVVGVLDGDDVHEARSGVTVWGYEEPLAKAVAALTPDANIIICLASVPREEAARDLARTCPAAVDVVIASGAAPAAAAAKRIKGRWLVFTKPWNRYVGVLKLKLDERDKVVAAENTYIPLTKEVAEDATARPLVKKYRDALRALVVAGGLLLEPVGETPNGSPYVGADKCAVCHEAPAAQWRATAHARAYDALVAAGRDVDPSCIKCHVTGYGYRGGFASPQETPDRLGVGCEECHGPGGAHAENGSTPLTPINEQTCIRCHESERSPAFPYNEYYAKVKH